MGYPIGALFIYVILLMLDLRIEIHEVPVKNAVAQARDA